MGSVAVVGVGVLAGPLCSAVLTRSLSGLLDGVASFDPMPSAGMAAAMLGVGLLASCLPARRASRLDPIASLRSE